MTQVHLKTLAFIGSSKRYGFVGYVIKTFLAGEKPVSRFAFHHHF